MEINITELEKKLDNNENVIIDFYAEWCGPCRRLKPIFEKVSKENENISMYTFNVDQGREFAIKHGIKSIPVVKVFKGHEVIDTKVGLLNENQILELIDLIR